MTTAKNVEKGFSEEILNDQPTKNSNQAHAIGMHQAYEKSKLKGWLSSETMSTKDGLYLLAGLDPSTVETRQEGLHCPPLLINALPLDKDISFLDDPCEKPVKKSFHGNDEAFHKFYEAYEKKQLVLKEHNDLFNALEHKLERSVKGLGEPAIKHGDAHFYAPVKFVEWAGFIQFIPAWFDWATDKGLLVFKNDNITKNIEKSFSTTERNTLFKLIIGMAIDAYGYEPNASKSPTPKEIADILAGLGMSITDDTVRKYLKQAADTVLPEKPRHSK